MANGNDMKRPGPVTPKVMEGAGVLLGHREPEPEGFANAPQYSAEEAALRKKARLNRARNGSAGYSTRGEGFLGLLLAVACAVALWAGLGISGAQARQQGALTLQQSVMDCALQCFAIEGAYPQTLAYLEEAYGLTIDHDSYTVIYDAFAANVPPVVTVVAK